MMLLPAILSKESEGLYKRGFWISRDQSEVKIFEFKCVGYDVLHELSACHLALWLQSKIRAAHIW